MSDGPIKMPVAPPLDDIILDDDGPTTVAVPPRASPSPSSVAKDADTLATLEADLPDDGGSQRAHDPSSNHVKGAAMPAKEPRKRSKMTLRIPDDEVSRPHLADGATPGTPIEGIPAIGSTRPPSSPSLEPVRPDRIITVNPPPRVASSPDDTLEMGGTPHGTLRRAPGIDAEQEAGWTPYQPMVADRADLGPDGTTERKDHPAAARALRTRDPQLTTIDEPGAGAMATRLHDSVAPVSEDIPIDTDDVLTQDPSGEAATNPRLPAAEDAEELKLDDAEELKLDDAEELKLDDAEELKPDEGERHTDPGEVPEVDAADLVSIESIPARLVPHPSHAPPPPKGGGLTPSTPPVTATALMSGVTSPSRTVPGTPLMASLPLATPQGVTALGSLGLAGAGLSPAALAVGRPLSAQAPLTAVARPPSAPPPTAPSPGAPQPHVPSAPPQAIVAPAAAGPAAGTPMARRPQPAGGPFGFMPSVGGLAPPAMNDAAANRKKTRPWWEDLFNDDFIRTMAKITDGDIAREAKFIEESLGCEAGATILDLACGTGRHAVELASRGYQVVGFDLSLAMLARASDEAQDRKQKINFVQGDMRDMNFEETFDGVFSWNTSFGYFEDEKNAAVIGKVHRALKKGGQFLLDVINRDCVIRQAPSLAWFEGDGCICMDEMQIDFISSRMKVKRTLMMDDGRTKEIEYSIRIYSLHELGKLLHDNGFRVAEVSGGTGTPGVFFGCEAPRTLILAEKR